jgi:Asp/Glu/hydantoin racemase
MVVKNSRPGPRYSRRVLVFNPNSSASMTDKFEPILEALPLAAGTTITYWTCPTGPAMISSQADMEESVAHCLPLLLKLAPDYDGFLGACYADHPIVRLMQKHMGTRPVVGIFDASVFAALQLLGPTSRFGIITTGAPYEALLTRGVRTLLGDDRRDLARFAGVAASGVGMADVSNMPLEECLEARRKICDATTKMIQREEDGEVDVLCMGGVLLAGMEAWVHEASEAMGREVEVIDQMAAGMLTLDALLGRRRLDSVDYRLALK